MYIWKDKEGKKLKLNEFIKRFKQGIDGITQLQQLKSQKNGTLISITGVILGIVMCIIGIKNLWWLMIILIGALINLTVAYIGTKQRIKQLTEIENKMKDLKEEQWI